MDRRAFIAMVGGSVLAAPLVAEGQPAQIARIGFLASRSRSTVSNPDSLYDAFSQGMGDLGYVLGKNLVIEWRFAEGNYERLPSLAAELVRLKVDLIVTHGPQGAEAAQRATKTIPIVVAAIIDPVGGGFAASLARPGGNITGLSNMHEDLGPKQLELLRVMVPRLSIVAVVANPSNSAHPAVIKSLKAAARPFDIRVLPLNASTLDEIERAFATMRREQVRASILLSDNFLLVHGQKIAALALVYRIPSLFPFREQVEAGGVMSYSADLTDLYRRAATYVDKILKGAKPGELPIERPTKFHLVINLKTAKALGLTIPQTLQLRADRVIE
jgi:putative ABC transport system substrate-binding protein